MKRRAEDEEAVVERKVAAIECAKEEPDLDPKVNESNDSLE